MTPNVRSSTIRDSIAELYDEADMERPSASRCIAPLDEALGAFNLTCTEITGLSARTAMGFLLRRGGISQLVDRHDEPLAGFLYTSPHFGSIFVEQTDPVIRRRFSIGHELGHYLLHFRPLLARLEKGSELFLIEAIDAKRNGKALEDDDLPMGRVVATDEDFAKQQLPHIAQMEREANLFAATLLMPEDVIHQLVGCYAPSIKDRDLTLRLAADMLVSREAMRWRLKGLGYAVA
jgi:hypothetical protein